MAEDKKLTQLNVITSASPASLIYVAIASGSSGSSVGITQSNLLTTGAGSGLMLKGEYAGTSASFVKNADFSTSASKVQNLYGIGVMSSTGGSQVAHNASGVSPGTFSYVDVNSTGHVTSGSLKTIPTQKYYASVSSSACPTIDTTSVDIYEITALATNLYLTPNTGALPTTGDMLMLIVTDSGSSHTIVPGAKYVNWMATIPSVTTAGSTMSMLFMSRSGSFMCLASGTKV